MGSGIRHVIAAPQVSWLIFVPMTCSNGIVSGVKIAPGQTQTLQRIHCDKSSESKIKTNGFF